MRDLAHATRLVGQELPLGVATSARGAAQTELVKDYVANNILGK